MRRPPGSAGRIALALAALVLVPALLRAIYLSPTTVFIDEHAPATQITVGNTGDQAEEASVELRFGFPDADSAGTPYIRFIDEPGPEYPSAAEWIRSFPARFRLEPNTQQIVRLMARPPDSLPDGEYWTRMIVTGRRAAAVMAANTLGVRAGLSLEIRLIATVLYRKGHVTTGIEIRNLSAEAEGDSLAVWAHMARLGNAAWQGTADVEVIQGRNTIVRHWSVPLAVYYPLRRRLAFPLESLAAGDYRVRVRMRAERSDLPPSRVLHAPTVVDSIPVRVL